jgi:myosin heavy subunit
MNTFGKIFAIINLILAITFLTFSFILWSKQTDWAAQYAKERNRAEKFQQQMSDLEERFDNYQASAGTSLTEMRTRVHQQEARIRECQDANTRLTNTNESLRGSFERITSEVQSLNALLDRAETDRDRLRKEIESMRQERQRAVAEATESERSAIELSADLKEAEAQLTELSKQNRRLMDQLMQARAAISNLGERGIAVEEVLSDTTPVTPITGQVVEVDSGTNIAVLNVGEGDGVRIGMPFLVSRGDEYVGRVRVNRVMSDMSVAVIEPELSKGTPRSGDLVQTQ